MELTRMTKFGYGVGHVLNDLCSALWFTYLLIYFHHVLLFNNTLAGVVLLIGQVADALTTPFVGREADRTDDMVFCAKYGRRKTWHLLGTVLVLVAFPFIFMGCLGCWEAQDWAQVVYYAPFVIIFQFGWASTQISHLALIPSLTQDPHVRTELTAIRYGFTVMSNIVVYSVTWVVLGLEPSQTGIGPEDAVKFRYIVGIVMVIGVMFAVAFHVIVKEDNGYAPLTPPSPCPGDQDPETTHCAANLPSHPCSTIDARPDVPHYRMKIGDWVREPQLYQIGMVYMTTRLFCNLTQAYVPIYLQDTLHLPQTSVAVIPLVMYTSGFLLTIIMKPLNKHIGRKGSFLIGAMIGTAGCIWVVLGSGETYTRYLIYPVASLLGAGSSIMLVTSLSLTADLIGPNVESGALIYGAMSFTDKLSNGIAVMCIQSFNPCVCPDNSQDTIQTAIDYQHVPVSSLLEVVMWTCCPKCSHYYRHIVGYVCGVAAILSAVAIFSLLPAKIGQRRRARSSSRADEESNEEVSGLVNPDSDPLLPATSTPSLTEVETGAGSGGVGFGGVGSGNVDRRNAEREAVVWDAANTDGGKDGLTHNITAHNNSSDNPTSDLNSSQEYQSVPQGLRNRLPSDEVVM